VAGQDPLDDELDAAIDAAIAKRAEK